MTKKTKSKKHPHSKLDAGYMTRARLILVSIGLVIVASALTVYILSSYYEEGAVPTDTPTVQTPDSDRLDAHSTSKTGATNPSGGSSTPTVITPSSTSDVPSLKPAPTQLSTVAAYQSTNWAGYLATGGDFTTITGSWTASNPSSTSTSSESGDGTWVGIGGVTTPDLIQIGTQNTISPSGIVSTSAFYELLPAGAVGITSVTVRPGDTISASIAETTKNQWTISLTNVTTGRTFSTVVPYASSYSSAEWIQEDPSYPTGGLVLLDNFGTVQFTNATSTMNGTMTPATRNNASPITLIGQGGATGHKGVPLSLSGNSFIVQYR